MSKVDEIMMMVDYWGAHYGENPAVPNGIRKAIEAIAQPVQEAEPVGYVDERVVYWLSDRRGKASARITTNLSAVKCAERPMPIYTAPQKSQPLSDEEKSDMWVRAINRNWHSFHKACIEYGTEIETFHGIKKGGAA